MFVCTVIRYYVRVMSDVIDNVDCVWYVRGVIINDECGYIWCFWGRASNFIRVAVTLKLV